MIVVPFFSLVLTVIFAHAILEPIGWKIGSAISSIVYSGITGDFRVIFGAIFGFIYAPLIITGLHHMTNAIENAATQEINVPAWISSWLGVTEPAIFAVNIPRLWPLMAGMCGCHLRIDNYNC